MCDQRGKIKSAAGGELVGIRRRDYALFSLAVSVGSSHITARFRDVDGLLSYIRVSWRGVDELPAVISWRETMSEDT